MTLSELRRELGAPDKIVAGLPPQVLPNGVIWNTPGYWLYNGIATMPDRPRPADAALMIQNDRISAVELRYTPTKQELDEQQRQT